MWIQPQTAKEYECGFSQAIVYIHNWLRCLEMNPAVVPISVFVFFRLFESETREV